MVTAWTVGVRLTTQSAPTLPRPVQRAGHSGTSTSGAGSPRTTGGAGSTPSAPGSTPAAKCLPTSTCSPRSGPAACYLHDFVIDDHPLVDDSTPRHSPSDRLRRRGRVSRRRGHLARPPRLKHVSFRPTAPDGARRHTSRTLPLATAARLSLRPPDTFGGPWSPRDCLLRGCLSSVHACPRAGPQARPVDQLSIPSCTSVPPPNTSLLPASLWA